MGTSRMFDRAMPFSTDAGVEPSLCCPREAVGASFLPILLDKHVSAARYAIHERPRRSAAKRLT